MGAARIRNIGPGVLIEIDAEPIPWDAAIMIAQEIVRAARQAETIAKANRIVFDQALAFRSGSPFGVTLDPKICAEARKEAAHNSELRKNIPVTPDVRRPVLGVPQVIDTGDIDGNKK